MPDGTSSSLTQVKISELPVAPTVNDADQLEANQAGTSRSITVGQVKAAAVAAVPMPPAITDTSPRSFGAVGDGVTDDTAALQAAINAVSAAGGGNINCTGGRWLIDSATLIIKNGVFLIGPWKNLGQPQTLVAGISYDYSTVKSALIVNPAVTIKLNEKDCGIQGMAVLRKGITTPTTVRQAYDLVQTFAGTGITVSDAATRAGTDAYLGHLFVAGFATGIASYSSRARMEWVAGDNTNGIYMTTSYDMQHLSHVHFYPFLTSQVTPAAYAVSGAVNNGSGLVRLTIAANVIQTGDRITVVGVGGVTGASGPFIATVVNPTTIDLVGSTFGGAYTSGGTVYLSAWYRSGVGINFDVDVDFGQMETCFAFHYATGIRVNSADMVNLINCGTDAYSNVNDTATVGILITGSSEVATLVGCRTSAQGVGLKCDTVAANQRNVVQVIGHHAWGNLTYAYEVSNGWASFTNCEASTGSQQVRIDDAALGVSFVGGDLTSVPFSYQSNASPRPSLISVRGAAMPINPVVNAVSGGSFIARFEGHNSTPAPNDALSKSYYLTNTAGAQVEIVRENYRASVVTAGAMSSQVYWTLQNAGVAANVLQLSSSSLLPLVNNTMNLGGTGNNWFGLFLGSGSAINWNNSAYTLTQSGSTLTASGALTLGGQLTGVGATLSANLQVGTAGASNSLVVRGTDNGNSFAIYNSANTKFLYVRPESATDTATVAYFNGSANANIDLQGTIKFSGAAPVALWTTAIAAGSATQAFIKASTTANLGIYYGTGVPGFSAAKGSIYSCTNATTTTTRLYVNTDGATTWANLTTSV